MHQEKSDQKSIDLISDELFNEEEDFLQWATRIVDSDIDSFSKFESNFC